MRGRFDAWSTCTPAWWGALLHTGHAGEEQLVPRNDGGQITLIEWDQQVLAPTQTTDRIAVDMHRARATNTVCDGGVNAPPTPAGLAEPAVSAACAPGEAVETRVHPPRGEPVAAGAQSARPVVVGRTALSTWMGLTPDPWLAVETEQPATIGLRLLAAGLAHGQWAHTGGAERFLPSLGVIVAEPVAAVSFVASAIRSPLRSATLSGSGIKSSSGAQSSTTQMTSRSSRRTLIGVPIHQRGHLAGADLQSGVSQASPHLSRLPDAALGGLHPQVPAHDGLTSLCFRDCRCHRDGRRCGRSPPPRRARCGRRVRGCTGSSWRASCVQEALEWP